MPDSGNQWETTMKPLITERLERYTDLDRETIVEVTKQVLIALELDDVTDPVTTTDSALEDMRDRIYTDAHYDGRKNGAEQTVAYLVRHSIIPPKDETTANLLIRKMFKGE